MFNPISCQSLAALILTAILIATAHASDCDKRSAHKASYSHEHLRGVKVDHSRLTKYSKHTLRKTVVHRHNAHHHKLNMARNAKPHAQSKAVATYTKTPRSTGTSKKANITGKDQLSVTSKNASQSAYTSAAGSKTTVSMSTLSSSCGSANPLSSITESGGPNGNQDFFNCGITSGGWTPPDVKMDMIKTVSLEAEPAKTTFAPCQKYNAIFEKYGAKYNIPPIFLAAFAMQESSCNADVKGDDGGAFGLMQITSDKCGGAPGGDCSNPDFNVNMGAKTFADGLSSANGNVLVALGAYNGWSKGLTKSQAIAAKNTGCCVCQQNLDYLQQFLNGWILGVDPYTKKLGIMRNLDSCGNTGL